jgi:hypothetical protein
VVPLELVADIHDDDVAVLGEVLAMARPMPPAAPVHEGGSLRHHTSSNGCRSTRAS